MEETRDEKKQAGEITCIVGCPDDFECCRCDFNDLAEVKTAPGSDLVECVDESRTNCRFRVRFGYKYYCTCPVRESVAKNLQQ